MRFVTREILVHPEDLTLDWIKRMEKARLNALGLHPVGGADARRSLQSAIDAHSSAESRALRAEAAARGISVEYEAHVMSWLLPREMFATKPEWFRVNDAGERTPDYNLCVSNPDALLYVSQRAKLLASLLDTGSHKYYYWLDDVSRSECRCQSCARLSAADRQLIAVNAMLAGIREYDAEAKICYIAYNDALAVPRSVEPSDGVFLEYAPINRSHCRPLNDADCPENVKESAPLAELLSFFGKKDAKVLDYWMDNSLFSGWKRPPRRFSLDEEVMRRDVDFYESLGFAEIASFGCFLGEDYRAMYGNPPLEKYGEILAE